MDTVYYVFEVRDGNFYTKLGEFEETSDAAAIAHAIRIGADYVWSYTRKTNPISVWSREEV